MPIEFKTQAAAPAAPRSLQATALPSARVRLTWTPGADHGAPISEFLVHVIPERSIGAESILSCAGTSCELGELLPSQRYAFFVEVRACVCARVCVCMCVRWRPAKGPAQGHHPYVLFLAAQSSTVRTGAERGWHFSSVGDHGLRHHSHEPGRNVSTKGAESGGSGCPL